MSSFAKLVSILFFFFSFLPTKTTAKSCPTTYCSSSEILLPVRFPFRLTSRNQDPRCGYPGFDLSCKNGNPTISLPSGDFVVRLINYGYQMLIIEDPQSCLPKRFLSGNFTVRGTPFRVGSFQRFTFLNCSSTENTTGDEMVSIPCLSGISFTVKAIPTVIFKPPPPSCLVISEALVPLPTLSQRWLDNWQWYRDAYIVFEWDEPSCYDCEQRGGDCGFKSDTGLELGCFNAPKKGSRSPKGVRYLLYTAGSIGILIFIGICARFYCSPSGNQRLLAANREISSGRIIINQNSANIVSMGLDDTIIGSYPKTLIGESCRLPNPTDNTCSICLSEYKAKEALRTIPDCGHYFHDDCIVEWLKLNATCPLCRNMPPRSVIR
ncbi:hypothetical protein UlMin_042516 [Ulmus minor]